MSIVNIFVILILCVCGLRESLKLQIAQIENVTLKSCGLKSIDSIPPKINTCYRWHKTIVEQIALRDIYNGRYAKEGEFPYTVLIKNRRWWLLGTAYCSGVLLNEYWVITAAHCLNDWSADEIRIYPGITAYPKNFVVYQAVSKIISHKEFNIKVFGSRFDIALIKLSSKVDRKRFKANGVCLPGSQFHIEPSELAVFSGWGYATDETENLNRLKTALIKIDRYVYGFLFRTTSIVDGAVLCIGDSGGPLVQFVNGRAVLIGILSATERDDERPCGYVRGMRFTSIPENLKWIKDTILNNS